MTFLTLMEQVQDVGQPEAASSMLTCNLHALHDERPLVLECPAMQRALNTGVLTRLELCQSGTVQDTSAVPAQCPKRTRSTAGRRATSTATEPRHQGRRGAMCSHAHGDGRVLYYAMEREVPQWGANTG